MSVDEQNPSRRKFIANVAGGTAAIAAAALSAPDLLAQGAPASAPQGGWDFKWVDRVTNAKHRMVFDAPGLAEGMAFNNASTWLRGYNEVYKTTDADMAAVLVFRHKGIGAALNDDMWSRLKLGEEDKLKDPTTGEPTMRNPFLSAKAGDKFASVQPDSSIESLLARGVTILCCNLALMRVVGTLAKTENMPREEAQTAVIAAVIPGIVRMPSGVFAAARAQEAGCQFLRST